MAGRLTPGALGWRKASAPVAPERPGARAVPPAPTNAGADHTAGPAADLDHTEALERWASNALERPRWMSEPEEPVSLVACPLDQPLAALLPESTSATACLPGPDPMTLARVPASPAAAFGEPFANDPVPDFDEATDRFALFALRSAEARSIFAADDLLMPLSFPAAEVRPTPRYASVAAQAAPEPVPEPTLPQGGSGWRPDDVVVSAEDMDADALRLEMLAARAAETRELRGELAGDLANPYALSPTAANPQAADETAKGSTWRRDMVAVSAEEFDADAARLELLASRAAERPTFLDAPDPVVEVPDEYVAFWRADAAVVTAEEFDADAARLESLAERGPLFGAAESAPLVESTPFWEQQERARVAAEQLAAAEAAARDAAANDQWHAQWERAAEQAAWRTEPTDPLGI